MNNPSKLRVLILTSSSSPYAPLMLAPVFERSQYEIVAVMTSAGTQNSRWKSFKTVVRTAGLRYAILKIILFGGIKIRQALHLYPKIELLCKKYGIRHASISSLKNGENSELLRSFRPDVLMTVLFEKIVPSEVIAIPAKAALNIHPAPLPRYAGVAPTFWVLSHGESSTAVTVHYLDEGIDTGDIALQQDILIHTGESVHKLYIRCCYTASELIMKALNQILASTLPRHPQKHEQRSYFSRPTKDAYRVLRRQGHSLYSASDLLSPLSSSSSG